MPSSPLRGALTLALLIASLSSGTAYAARPDLVVRAVSAPPAALQAGSGFEVAATVANRGRGRAPRSRVRFVLRGGVRAALGAGSVRALRPRKRARGAVTLTVPATLAAGVYRLTACADAGGRVRERSERNNCRTARGQIAVSVARPLPDMLPAPVPDRPAPDPVAPPIDPTVASSLADGAAFLYTGPDRVQTGVAPGTIERRRVAVVRGRVTGRTGDPLAGVAVTVLGHPELGSTTTRADGRYDLAVNGGGTVTLEYAKAGVLPAQRAVRTRWQDYAHVDDVALVPLDPEVTEIATGAGAPVQVARGSETTDADGTRRATMIFDAGTTAVMELPDGSTRPLDDLEVRATEYTVGDAGVNAMPGDLPASSGYTYAAELSVDDALAAGATDVRFSKPVAVYVENFLGFPVGGAVPAGYYDRERGTWVASENGRVIEVVGDAGDVDTDGDGAADNAGIDAAERARLATLYDAGQELWRTEVAHFTPWDFNWPYGPPDDAVRPNGDTPQVAGGPLPGSTDDCIERGSSIGCLSRTLGEAIEVPGTRHRLTYTTARAIGRTAERTVVIPLSGPTVPASLRRIMLDVRVAGQRHVRSFPAAANQSFRFVWDGRDGYGRPLQGEQRVWSNITFVYGGVYYSQRADFERAFSRVNRGGVTAIFGRDATTVSVSRVWQGTVGGWNAVDGGGLGGWSLDAHHSYSPVTQTLYRGDGTSRTAGNVSRVVTAFAGTGVDSSLGDGGPAVEARLRTPEDVAVGPDGSVYVAERGGDRIRRVRPDGTIVTVAGRGGCPSLTDCFSGDGGPATQAQLHRPTGIAVGPDGTLYLADELNHRIRRVAPDGTIMTIAGTGQTCDPCADDGDGGPATEARLTHPLRMELAPDGSLYFVDAGARVRRIGPDGVITTVAGDGNSGADDIPAAQSALGAPRGLAVGPDGSVYVSEVTSHKVRRITPDGMIRRVAGTGFAGFGGDGGPATAALLRNPIGIAVAADGTVYIVDEGNVRIRRVAADGTITTLAGSGARCSSTTGCIDDMPAPQARWYIPASIDAAPDGSLYVADRGHRVRRIGSPLPGFGSGQILIASEDGTELDVFDARGRHLDTRDATTGVVRARFTYDGAGRLSAVTGRDGDVTAIERDAAGRPTAIIAPGGQRTALAVDANGHLSRVATVTLTTTGDGLLTGLREPGGATHTFEYDDDGNLTRDTGPAGAQTLTRSSQPGGWKVTHAGPTGSATTFSVRRLANGDVERTMTAPGAGTTTALEKPDGTRVTTTPAGDRMELVLGPDPRFGMQAPVAASARLTTPAGRTATITGRRTAELSGRELVRQTDEITTGGLTTRATYDLAARTLTTVTAEGRTTVTTFDAKGRPITRAPAGVAPTSYAYTAQGRLRQVVRGGRTITYAYDAAGRIVAKADAAGTTTYAYDGDRLTTATLPGGRLYRFAYDANGRRTAVTLPSGAVHAFAYDAAGNPERFMPAGSAPYVFSRGAVTLPSGRTETYTRDAAERLTGVAYAEAAQSFSHDAVGRLAGFSWTRGGVSQQSAFAYDGDLLTGAAGFSYDYDADLRLAGITLGDETTALGYDRDDLLTTLGPFTFTRGPAGFASRIADGQRSVDVAHDANGRIASRTYTSGGAQVYSIAFEYDDADRVTERRERRGGGPVRTTTYAYDAAGRLATVRVDGAVTESYSYNPDGDRLPATGATFDADGFMTSRGGRSFTYGTRGELLSAGSVTYAYDAAGRRVSRTEDGVTTEYLYGNPANAFEVTATRGPGGLTRYFRDDRGAVFAFSRGGQPYLVATDQVGSAVAIADAAGAVVKAVTYDSYGVETSDSDPAFPYPFGFAGGLADETTGLVRFGLRDFDPESGRWTARDPGLDSTLGGNLYAYVGNDPVNRVDAAGLWSIGLSAYEGVGGGITLAITDAGISWCGEVGVGVEASIEFNPEAGLEDPRYGLFGEAELEIGGIASASLKLEHVIPCAPGSKPTTPGRRDFKFKPEVCFTFLCAEGGDFKAKGKPTLDWQEFKPKYEPGFGVGGKAGARVCNQVRW